MPRYILLSTLTAEGYKTVKERPNRILEVNKEIEIHGAKVLDQYAVLGPYDFVTIIDAPDNVAAAQVSVDLCSRGTVKIITMAATQTGEFAAQIWKKPSQPQK